MLTAKAKDKQTELDALKAADAEPTTELESVRKRLEDLMNPSVAKEKASSGEFRFPCVGFFHYSRADSHFFPHTLLVWSDLIILVD